MAQADGGHGQARQRDHRAGHGPEGDAGHHASAEDAHTLQREDDSRQRDEDPETDERDPPHDGYLFLRLLDMAHHRAGLWYVDSVSPLGTCNY